MPSNSGFFQDPPNFWLYSKCILMKILQKLICKIYGKMCKFYHKNVTQQVKLNFWPVLFYAPKNENQRKSHFWSLFEYVAFFFFILSKKGTKNANIFKVPRSPMEIFKTFIFNYMIVKYTNFQLHKVARLKENHVTSQGYKS